MKCLDCSKIVDFDATIQELLNMRGTIDVLFEDGETVLFPVRRVILYLFYWRIVRKMRFKITKKYTIPDKNINSASIDKLGTIILRDLIETDTDYLDEFKSDLWKLMNDLMNFIMINCQEYQQTIDIVSLCRLAKHPDIVEITNDKVRGRSDSIIESERKLKKNQIKLFESIKKIDEPWNGLGHFSNLRFINQTQIAHIFYQVGFRTDINDDIIALPITTGYLEGLEDLEAHAFESLSAKKAIYYNRMSIPDSQYFNRGQHLVLACLQHLRPGDCGSTMLIDYYITEKNKHDFLYKNIIDGTRMVSLDHSNIKNYVNRMIRMRSPLTCLIQDGTCEVCAGKLLSSLPKGVHIGIVSGIKITNVVVQKILSSKHFQNTSIVEYIMPKELDNLLVLRKSFIFVKPQSIKTFDKLHIGIQIKDAIHLLNLGSMNIENIDTLSEEQFGSAASVVVKRSDGTLLTDEINLMLGRRAPLFSKDFIKHIKLNDKHVYTDTDMIWIPMEGFDTTKPIFKVIIENDSMIEFVNNFAKFLKGDIQKHHAINEAFCKFIELINRQVNINIAYAEVVLKTYLVSGEYNTTIPEIKDQNNVMFSKFSKINMSRSLGATLAYEQLHTTMTDPVNYMMPRSQSTFDTFMNFKPMTDIPSVANLLPNKNA